MDEEWPIRESVAAVSDMMVGQPSATFCGWSTLRQNLNWKNCYEYAVTQWATFEVAH